MKEDLLGNKQKEDCQGLFIKKQARVNILKWKRFGKLSKNEQKQDAMWQANERWYAVVL